MWIKWENLRLKIWIKWKNLENKTVDKIKNNKTVEDLKTQFKLKHEKFKMWIK